MRISVIIPTLNEASRIASLIDATRRLGADEIIVIDGGSSDNTLKEAVEADLLLSTTAGRAIQQNAGATAATGEVLLFLHADCALTEGCFPAIRNALQDINCVGGCFQQQIDADGIRYRILERGNALRVRLLKWAYGDQGIFVRRDLFHQLGKFPELRLMEDLYFMKKLNRKGRFVLLDEKIQVSARRWQQQGLFSQTLRNWCLITLAHCGISPNRLAKFYPHVR